MPTVYNEISDSASGKSTGFSSYATRHRLAPYFPGLVLFFIAIIVALLTYKTYGMSWDEMTMHDLGTVTYDYITKGSKELLTHPIRQYGQAFEVPLIFIEKNLNLTDSRDIYLMRHLVTHLLFLISALSIYILAFRLFRNRFIASLAFIMLVCAPRLYAHSFFNSRDLPFLSMITISLCYAQIAFEKDKSWLYFILGLFCGYTTAIRIMGIMLGSFILLFLLIDFLYGINSRKTAAKSLLKLFLFPLGFCLALYAAWPYLWQNPVHNFMESFSSFSRFPWEGSVLLKGEVIKATQLPWTYFPIWFLISNPELWLITGFAGIIWILISFFKKPIKFILNNVNRNFTLYLMCFFAPVITVIYLHSVLYDDWRHLYFVYPPFILMGLYFFSKIMKTRYKSVLQGLCLLQISLIFVFMISAFPFEQVYFNNFVSHKKEYLRKNYELDYWGSGFKQGIEYILKTDTSKTIRISGDIGCLLQYNIAMIPKNDRARIQYKHIPEADYMVANYRNHPGDFNVGPEIYAVHVLNSTVLSVFKLDKSKQENK